jgi:hypothetical protein
MQQRNDLSRLLKKIYDREQRATGAIMLMAHYNATQNK